MHPNTFFLTKASNFSNLFKKRHKQTIIPALYLRKQGRKEPNLQRVIRRIKSGIGSESCYLYTLPVTLPCQQLLKLSQECYALLNGKKAVHMLVNRKAGVPPVTISIKM